MNLFRAAALISVSGRQPSILLQPGSLQSHDGTDGRARGCCADKLQRHGLLHGDGRAKINELYNQHNMSFVGWWTFTQDADSENSTPEVHADH